MDEETKTNLLDLLCLVEQAAQKVDRALSEVEYHDMQEADNLSNLKTALACLEMVEQDLTTRLDAEGVL